MSHSTTEATSRSVWLPGLIAAAFAALVTTGGAALASGLGVTFADKTGATIPLAGFAMLTAIFSLIGVILAAILAAKARHPRRTFVRITIVLVVLSFIPDLLPSMGFDRATSFTLIALHVLAARGDPVPAMVRRPAYIGTAVKP